MLLSRWSGTKTIILFWHCFLDLETAGGQKLSVTCTHDDVEEKSIGEAFSITCAGKPYVSTFPHSVSQSGRVTFNAQLLKLGDLVSLSPFYSPRCRLYFFRIQILAKFTLSISKLKRRLVYTGIFTFLAT